MKKFKGVVNGVSYDTEKAYREAVDKALKDGNVTACSRYYEVEEPKKETDKPYQLTKEDMDDIRLFNKNFNAIKSFVDKIDSFNKNFNAIKSFVDKIDSTTFSNTIRVPGLTKIIDAFN